MGYPAYVHHHDPLAKLWPIHATRGSRQRSEQGRIHGILHHHALIFTALDTQQRDYADGAVERNEDAGALPEESRALFIDFEKKDWKDEDRALFNSLYPNLGTWRNTSDYVDEGEMDKFLKKRDHLTLGDS